MAVGARIKSFNSPISPNGLACDGVHLWVVGPNGSVVVEVSPVNGTIIRTIPIQIPNARSVAVSSTRIWVMDDASSLEILDKSTGNLIRTVSVSDRPDFITHDGTNLWGATSSSVRLLSMENWSYSISVLTTSYPSQGIAVSPNGDIYLSNNGFVDQIERYDRSGQLIQIIPGQSSNPRGLALDGRTLWHTDINTGLIYQLSLD